MKKFLTSHFARVTAFFIDLLLMMVAFFLPPIHGVIAYPQHDLQMSPVIVFSCLGYLVVMCFLSVYFSMLYKHSPCSVRMAGIFGFITEGCVYSLGSSEGESDNPICEI